MLLKIMLYSKKENKAYNMLDTRLNLNGIQVHF